VNAAPALPAGIVAEVGTVAAGLLLLNVTAMPPAGAGPLNISVPVEFVPPVTVAGLKLTELKPGGETVKLAVRLAPP